MQEHGLEVYETILYRLPYIVCLLPGSVKTLIRKKITINSNDIRLFLEFIM